MLASLALVSADAETYVKLIIRHTWFLLPAWRCTRQQPAVGHLGLALHQLLQHFHQQRIHSVAEKARDAPCYFVRLVDADNLLLFADVLFVLHTFFILFPIFRRNFALASPRWTHTSAIDFEALETRDQAGSRQPSACAGHLHRCSRQHTVCNAGTVYFRNSNCRIQFRDIVTQRDPIKITGLPTCDTVASLSLQSPGSATDGVTIFFPLKN